MNEFYKYKINQIIKSEKKNKRIYIILFNKL